VVHGDGFVSRITRVFSIDIYFQYIHLTIGKVILKHRYTVVVFFVLEHGNNLVTVIDSCNAIHFTESNMT
jgi:hypothetical protein